MNNKNQKSEIKKAKEQSFEEAFNIVYASIFIAIIIMEITQ